MTHVDLQLITYLPDNAWWRSLIQEFAQLDSPFEIRCFREQTAEITEALRYGMIQDSDNGGEVTIKGQVTEAFLSHLIHTEKPCETDIHNKMTKFFMLNLGHTFCSSHYGTEIGIFNLSKSKVQAFERIILPVRSSFSILVYDSDIDSYSL